MLFLLEPEYTEDYVTKLWILFRPPILATFLYQHLRRRRGFLIAVGRPPRGLCWHYPRALLLTTCWRGSSCFYVASTDSAGGEGASPHPGEHGLLRSSSSLCWCRRVWRQFFLWWLNREECFFWKFAFLLGCLFYRRESRFLLVCFVFVFVCPIGILVCWLLHLQVWDRWGKRRPRKHHRVVLRVFQILLVG